MPNAPHQKLTLLLLLSLRKSSSIVESVLFTFHHEVLRSIFYLKTEIGLRKAGSTPSRGDVSPIPHQNGMLANLETSYGYMRNLRK